MKSRDERISSKQVTLENKYQSSQIKEKRYFLSTSFVGNMKICIIQRKKIKVCNEM